MTYLMTVMDSFWLPDRGLVITGANPELDHLPVEQIKATVGTSVRLLDLGGGTRVMSVKGVDVSKSLIGKANIMIALGDVESSQIVLGTKVFVDIDTAGQ